MTEFELKLKELFPEVYAIYLLSKDEDKGGGGEKHIWDLLDALVEMNQSISSGTMMIGFDKGHITKLEVKKDILAYRSQPKLPTIDTKEEPTV